MKELDKKNTIEIREERQELKSLTLQGSVRKIRGLSFWSCDPDGNVVKIELNKPVFDMGKDKIKHDVTLDNGLWYIQALNKKNAIKQFKKLGRVNAK